MNRQPTLKQLIFNWEAKDKYVEIKNFEMDAINSFMTNQYEKQKTLAGQRKPTLHIDPLNSSARGI